MFKNKNLKWLLLLLTILILLEIPGYAWMKQANNTRAQRSKSLLSPVIMVPGSSATTERFNELIDQLNQTTAKKHSVLKITVSREAKLTYRGSINKNDQEPFIIIGFDNNKDGYANIKKQSQWLDVAFKSLMENYKFNNFKVFGHSNGGLIWTYWLEHYYQQYASETKMKCLMTLGTPYNFTENNPNNHTQMLADFIKKRNKLPHNLKVYSLYGGKNYESDGIVPETSVAAGKFIFQNQVKAYTAVMVTGEKADHSELPQNKQIIQVIQQYLLENDKPPKDNKEKDD
ncbi:alpha/beta hydrolase [Lactobacillus sp. ESL0684]|uniref:alpha/beta hydrolase n=1 Tax=Lactobacillus sp. ESL0684 TaxID=2983213 RepID=UPI0023F79FAE|nr:alpha/beta hydrolase [Lactobacillus sp. ESL0684]WEV43619.1 alpha/beta hydrolase [Lactobacillus sp. ESL0684]